MALLSDSDGDMPIGTEKVPQQGAYQEDNMWIKNLCQTALRAAGMTTRTTAGCLFSFWQWAITTVCMQILGKIRVKDQQH